jgi:hypothetical protein
MVEDTGAGLKRGRVLLSKTLSACAIGFWIANVPVNFESIKIDPILDQANVSFGQRLCKNENFRSD